MAEAQDHPFKVIIIGSGLSGGLLANGLIHASVPVTVYERMEEDSNREGYQIRLGAPALVGMRACLSDAHITSLVRKFGRAGGKKAAAPLIRHKDFKCLLDLGNSSSYSKSAPISRRILRDSLAEPLSRAGCLHYTKKFVKYDIVETEGGERVRVWFHDNTSDECDILIGADGSNSRVNKQLGLNNISEIRSHVSMLTKAELPTERFLQMCPEIFKGPVISFVDDKTLFFAAYLPDPDKGSSNAANFDEKLSSCVLGVSVPTHTVPENLEKLSMSEKWDFIADSMSDWSSEFHEILSTVRGAALYTYNGRVSTRPSRTWRKDVRDSQRKGHPRVWLIGDAMHAMLPNRGMGGNQAMCDTATALPLLVNLAEKSQSQSLAESDIEKACQEYEDEMIPRAFDWVKKSGGQQVAPFDTSNLSGKLLMAAISYFMMLVQFWDRVKPWLGIAVKENLDDAPELKE